MALLNSTFTSTVPAPVNFVLMETLLSAARKRLPYFNGTLPGSLEKKQGAANVKWRRIENLTPVTAALGEGLESTTPAFGNGRDSVRPTITDITTAIEKFGNAITLSEEIDLFNVNSDSAALMDTLGANAGESLNSLMRNVFATTTAIVRHANNAAQISSVAAAISLTDIKFCTNRLNRNSAMKFTPAGFGSQNYNTQPIRQSYYGICHVDVEEDIRSLTGFIPVEQYGGYTETEPGEFGAVGGVRWCSTETAPIVSDGSSESIVAGSFNENSATAHHVYRSFIYGREAVGSIGLGEQHAKEIYQMFEKMPTVELIYHKPGTSGVADPFNERGSLAWKSWFGGKVLNSSWCAMVNTLATKLG